MPTPSPPTPPSAATASTASIWNQTARSDATTKMTRVSSLPLSPKSLPRVQAVITTVHTLPWPERGQPSDEHWTSILRAAQACGFLSPAAFRSWWSAHFDKSLDWALLQTFPSTLAGMAWKGLHPNESAQTELAVAHACLQDWAGFGLAQLEIVACKGKLGARLRLASMLMVAAELAPFSSTFLSSSSVGGAETTMAGVADILWSLPGNVTGLPTPVATDEESGGKKREEDDLSSGVQSVDQSPPDRRAMEEVTTASADDVTNPPSLPTSPHASDPTFEAGVAFLDWRDPARTPLCLQANEDADPLLTMTTYYLPADQAQHQDQGRDRVGVARAPASSSSASRSTRRRRRPSSVMSEGGILPSLRATTRRRSRRNGRGEGAAEQSEEEHEEQKHDRLRTWLRARPRMRRRRSVVSDSEDEADGSASGSGNGSSNGTTRSMDEEEQAEEPYHRRRRQRKSPRLDTVTWGKLGAAPAPSSVTAIKKEKTSSAQLFPLLKLTSEPRAPAPAPAATFAPAPDS